MPAGIGPARATRTPHEHRGRWARPRTRPPKAIRLRPRGRDAEPASLTRASPLTPRRAGGSRRAPRRPARPGDPAPVLALVLHSLADQTGATRADLVPDVADTLRRRSGCRTPNVLSAYAIDHGRPDRR